MMIWRERIGRWRSFAWVRIELLQFPSLMSSIWVMGASLCIEAEGVVRGIFSCLLEPAMGPVVTQLHGENLAVHVEHVIKTASSYASLCKTSRRLDQRLGVHTKTILRFKLLGLEVLTSVYVMSLIGIDQESNFHHSCTST